MNNSTLARTGRHGAGKQDCGRQGPNLPLVAAGKVRFEPFHILDRVDSSKRFQLPLDPSFPLAINLYEFPPVPRAVPMTWHERLEIFCPLGGPGAFRIGEHIEPFEAGDILLIDNLRLHGVDRFEGDHPRALVVVFYRELVAPPGALPCDMWLLRPFQHLGNGCLRLTWGNARTGQAWECLNRLIQTQIEGPENPAVQARMKLLLAELLLVLEEAFRDRVSENFDYERRRDRLRRVAPLLDHLAANLPEATPVSAAARMLRMSNSYFMRFFRAATGLTFSSYVDHLRTSRACQLLLESDLSLAQIAAETGFCDQSHLSRHIRRRLGKSPGQIRAQRGAASQTAGKTSGR